MTDDKNIIETFKSKKINRYVSNLLSYCPFFLRYPFRLFIYLISKSFKSPSYLIILFIIFAIIKRVVRTNTYYWSWAY